VVQVLRAEGLVKPREVKPTKAAPPAPEPIRRTTAQNARLLAKAIRRITQIAATTVPKRTPYLNQYATALKDLQK
jgi:hypothetical protein